MTPTPDPIPPRRSRVQRVLVALAMVATTVTVVCQSLAALTDLLRLWIS